jgi:hypothetical protein
MLAIQNPKRGRGRTRLELFSKDSGRVRSHELHCLHQRPMSTTRGGYALAECLTLLCNLDSHGRPVSSAGDAMA